MTSGGSLLLLILDLLGTFAFALNGALIAIRNSRIDIVGVIALAMITALGGGILRDIMIGNVPPETFRDWRYLAVAAGGGLVAFGFSPHLARFGNFIELFDAAGLSLFAVTGALTALDFGLGGGQAVILGAVTGVGGGTIRDVLVRKVPSVLSSTGGLYAIPALIGATIFVVGHGLGANQIVIAIVAAAVCFAIRMVGVHLDLTAPTPRGTKD